MKIDLHTHTIYSRDSITSTDKYIRGVKSSPVDAVAVTDHNTIEGALKIKERAKFKVIVGEEIDSQEGHVIGLFLKKRVPPKFSIKKTIELIKSQGGLAGIAHPLNRFGGHAVNEKECLSVIHLVDFLEGFNSTFFDNFREKKIEKFAKKFNLPLSAGSDAHETRRIGHGHVEMEDFDENDPKDFLAKLKKSRIVKYKRSNNILMTIREVFGFGFIRLFMNPH